MIYFYTNVRKTNIEKTLHTNAGQTYISYTARQSKQVVCHAATLLLITNLLNTCTAAHQRKQALCRAANINFSKWVSGSTETRQPNPKGYPRTRSAPHVSSCFHTKFASVNSLLQTSQENLSHQAIDGKFLWAERHIACDAITHH